MNEENPYFLIPIFIIGFPLAFAAIWSLVSLILSVVGGWSGLAKQYRCQQQPAGESLRHYWMMMGVVSYRGVATLQARPEGLYLSMMVLFRLGHPALLIPWSDIKQRGTAQQGLLNWTTLELGTPKVTTLRLPSSETVIATLGQFLSTPSSKGLQ